jgi:hypothetical protein
MMQHVLQKTNVRPALGALRSEVGQIITRYNADNVWAIPQYLFSCFSP